MLQLQWVQQLRSRARLLISNLTIIEFKIIIFFIDVMLMFINFIQGFLSDVLKCLGDNKKHMRECTLTTLDSWLSAVHLDKMVILYFFLEYERFGFRCHDKTVLVGSLYCSSFDRHQSWRRREKRSF